MDRRNLIRAALVAGAGLAAVSGCDASRSDRAPTAAGARSAPSVKPSIKPSTKPSTKPPTKPPIRPPIESSADTTSPRPAVGAPAEISHGPTDRPAVALTFHGQGDPAMVERLLGEIEAAGALVTVMAVGSWLATQPTMAQRILDHGHELGNHTQHHVDIKQLSAAAAYAEIEGCAQVLRQLTGSSRRWFRPSQTQHATPLIETEARRVGYMTCLSYDVDSLDYTDPPPATVAHTVLSQVRNGSIVSMHCGHATTVAAIVPILDGLRTRGLRAVTVSQLVNG